jgi:uncharacterized protein YutE (UPF0331/DUF86 family)
MGDDMSDTEAQHVQEVARRYERKGYEVQVEPRGFVIPGGPPDYRPDLVARRGDECIIVEVSSGASLSHNPQLTAVVQAIEVTPGWKFELVRTPTPTEPTPGELAIMSRAQAESLVDAANSIATVDTYGAALILAWSAAEAAMRYAAEHLQVSLAELKPRDVPKQLVAYGLLPRADLELLSQASDARNALAHGFTPGQPVSSEMVQGVLRIAKTLLGSTAEPEDC